MAKKTEKTDGIAVQGSEKKQDPANCGVCEDCLTVPVIDEIVCAYHYNRNQGDTLHVIRTSHEVRSSMCPLISTKATKAKYIREKI